MSNSGVSQKANNRRGGKQSPLKEFLELHQGETHVIVLQDYPDPDAISSALAYQIIANEFGIKTATMYSGKISHQQNIAMVRLLGIPLLPYSQTHNFQQYDGAVFIDNQGTTSGDIVQSLEAAQVPALIIIDHHELQDRLSPEFSDIRRVGATATIFAGYLEQGLIQMDSSRKEHIVMGTALMHGLMTDTGNFIRASEQDLYAAAYLTRFRDMDLLANIMNQSRSKQVMEVINKALVNRILADNFSIAGIGFLRTEDRDVIPQAADFLLTEENVHTAIVYGIVRGADREERVVGSMRTTKLTLDPDDFIKDALGKDTRGYYFGGGKITAGGFEIPIGFLSGGEVEEYQEIKWKVYDNQIKQKIFSKIGYQNQ